jgi:anti-anti-sigma factor
MSALFDLVERPLDSRTRLVAPRGELDAATNPTFRAALQACAEGEGERIVVDLTEVSFMSAGAIGVIARVWARMERAHRQLIVVCPSPRIYRLFEIAGLTGDLDIREALPA